MTKSMELYKVRNGERFTLNDVEFVKLDDDREASFVLMVNTLPDTCAFEKENSERDDHNNFVGSNVQRVIDEWLREHRTVHAAVIERPIDLTSMDGMTDYGTPYVYGRILTIDEYRKYRRFIPLTEECYWTATPWCTLRSSYSSRYNRAYRVYTDGSVGDGLAYSANSCARPALYLEASILVSVEEDDVEKVLQDYTDTELLDELLRRRVEK